MTAEPMPRDLEAVLRFEARNAGKTDAMLGPLVRMAFGCSLIRYRQRLLRAIRHPKALEVDAQTVRRLERLLAAHKARRTLANAQRT